MNNDKIRELMEGNRVGLGALPQRTTARRAESVLEIPTERFRHDPNNARKSMDQDELAALAEDMRRHGQLQNVVAWLDETNGEYEIIGGNRRLVAARLAEIKTLICKVVPREQAAEVKEEMSFAENLCRVDLKPTEVARHWQQLMERWNCSTRELAARVGVAQSTISKRLKLLQLDADTQCKVDAGKVLKTSVVQSLTNKRTKNKPRGPYGVHTFASGTVKLKRGATLADLLAEVQRATAAGQDSAAA